MILWDGQVFQICVYIRDRRPFWEKTQGRKVKNNKLCYIIFLVLTKQVILT